MSLHVSIGPRWTFASHCSVGRRGYLVGSSKRPSSFLTSSFNVSTRRLHQTPTIYHSLDRRCLRNTQVASGSFSVTAKQPSLLLDHRAASFGTSAGGSDTLPTHVNVQDSENAIPTSDQRLVSVSYHDGSSDPVTDQILSLPVTSQGEDAVSQQQSENPVSVGEWSRFTLLRSRRLPRSFLTELTRLGVLLSEERGLEYIREAFGDVVSARDSLLRLHGSEIDRWLEGTWKPSKAMRVMQLLLGSIVTSPHEILEDLQRLGEMDDDFTVRCQCLSYTGHMYKDILATDPELMAKFDSEVRKLTSPDRWPTEEMRRRHLSLLLWLKNREEAGELILQFLQKYPVRSVPTSLYLAMYSAQNGMESLALSILTDLPSEELQSPNLLTLQCCQVLLRYDAVETTLDGPNFKFLPRLLEKGLTPDNILYSRIIERALESGYPAVAWDVFRHLQATKVEITGWTYLVLLRHAFNHNNVTIVQELMSEIQQREILYTNVHLLTYSMNVVRRIFYNENSMSTAESLSHILALYDRVFTREPLIKLNIVPSLVSHKPKATTAPSETAGEVVQPDAYCLSFTVWAFVLSHRSSRRVRKLWIRIRELVEAGDMSIVDCMRLDLIYNAFIWLSLRDRQAAGMTFALEVLRYMLTKQLCEPTDRTWSILICGFLRYNQKAQAKHIYELMKQCKLSMKDIRKEYWRGNWTFEYFEENLETILDENMMPDGTEGTEVEKALKDQLRYKDRTEELDSESKSDLWSLEVERGEEQGQKPRWEIAAPCQ